ncbi:MAG: hypothetical protein AMXMBFR53_42770 [Gemmatimonadota bacterium]
MSQPKSTTPDLPPELLDRIRARRAAIGQDAVRDDADLVRRIRERRDVIQREEGTPEPAAQEPGVLERGRVALGRIGSALIRPLGERRPAPERPEGAVAALDVGGVPSVPATEQVGPRVYTHGQDPHDAILPDRRPPQPPDDEAVPPIGEPMTGRQARQRSGKVLAAVREEARATDLRAALAAEAGEFARGLGEVLAVGMNPGNVVGVLADAMEPGRTVRDAAADILSRPVVGSLARAGVGMEASMVRGGARLAETTGVEGVAESLRRGAQGIEAVTAEAHEGRVRKTAETFGISEDWAKRITGFGDMLSSGIVTSAAIMAGGPALATPAMFAMGLGELDQEAEAKGLTPEERSVLLELGTAYGYAKIEMLGELPATPGFRRLVGRYARLLPQGLEADVLKGTPIPKIMAKFGLTEMVEEAAQELATMGAVAMEGEGRQYTPEEVLKRAGLAAVGGLVGSLPMGAIAGLGVRRHRESAAAEPGAAPGVPGDVPPASGASEGGAEFSEPPTRSGPGAAAVVQPAARGEEGGRRLRRRLAEIVDPSLKAELDEAYIDRRTGLQSKAAYEAARERIDADPGQHVLLVDMANAKARNDTKGWASTDALLREAADLLRPIAERHGIPERGLFSPAGDELVVTAPTPETAGEVGVRLKEAFGQREIEGTGYHNWLRYGVGGTFAEAEAAANAKKAGETLASYRGGGMAPSTESATTPEPGAPVEEAPGGTLVEGQPSGAGEVERLAPEAQGADQGPATDVEELPNHVLGALAREHGVDPALKRSDIIEQLRAKGVTSALDAAEPLLPSTAGARAPGAQQGEELSEAGEERPPEPLQDGEEVVVLPGTAFAEKHPDLVGKRVTVDMPASPDGGRALSVRYGHELHEALLEDLRRPGDEDLEAARQRGLFEGEDVPAEAISAPPEWKGIVDELARRTYGMTAAEMLGAKPGSDWGADRYYSMRYTPEEVLEALAEYAEEHGTLEGGDGGQAFSVRGGVESYEAQLKKPTPAGGGPREESAAAEATLTAIGGDPSFRATFPDGEATPWEAGSTALPTRQGLGPDLMEAGRMLAAAPRYKKLRGMMLGVFRVRGRDSRIEIGDVRWLRTMAHEVGHAVDYRLHGDSFPSSILKRFPGLAITEAEAREELKRASEFVRPLDGLSWTDRKDAHVRYRAQHRELMADLFSLYVLDREQAARLAPSVTAAMEAAIAKRPEIQSAVDAVLRPESTGTSSARHDEQRTTLPEWVAPPLSKANPAARDEAFAAVKAAAREYQAQFTRVMTTARRWRRALTEEQRADVSAFVEGIGRPDHPGETLEDVRGRMTPAMRKVAREYRYEQELNRQEANKLFAEAGAGNELIHYLADYLPHFYRVDRKKALAFAGRWRKRTPHTQQRTFPTLAEAVAGGLEPLTLDIAYLYEKSAENNFKAAVARRLARQIKDMRTSDGAPLMVNNLTEAGGDWVKIDHPVLRHVYARKGPGGELVLGEGSAYVHPSIARPVQVLLQRPFRGPLAGPLTALNAAGKGLNVAFSFFHEVALFESSSAVNMRFLNPLRGLVIGPFEARRLGLAFRPYLTYRAGLELQLDPIGAEDAARHGLVLGHQASVDYARSFMERLLRAAETKHPRLGGAAAGAAVGFKVGAGVTGAAARAAVPIPGVRTAVGVLTGLPGGIAGAMGGAGLGAVVGAKPIRRIYEAYQAHLWDNVHAGLKLHAYHSLVAEIIPDLPAGTSVRYAKELIASHVNDAFGGQEFLEAPSLERGHAALSEPATVRGVQAAHWLLLAPDWTMSNIRIAGRPILNARNPLHRKLGARYWRNMGVTLALLPMIVQAAIHSLWGDDDEDLKPNPWENEPGREGDIDVTPIARRVSRLLGAEDDGRRRYARIGKQAKEVVRYFEDAPDGFMENLGSKSSVVVRTFVEQLTSHAAGSGYPAPWAETAFADGLRGWDQVVSRGKTAASHFVPFSFGSNQFAFALPERLGMSRFRAAKTYEEALEAWADPSWWDAAKARAKRDATPQQRSAATQDLLARIEDALRANGYDEEERAAVWNAAMAKVRSTHYRQFWTAVEANDREAAESAAGVLLRLGADRDGFERSAKARRMELGPGQDAIIQEAGQAGGASTQSPTPEADETPARQGERRRRKPRNSSR